MERSRKRNTGAEATTSMAAQAKQERELTSEGQEEIWGIKGMILGLDAGDVCSNAYTY